MIRCRDQAGRRRVTLRTMMDVAWLLFTVGLLAGATGFAVTLDAWWWLALVPYGCFSVVVANWYLASIREGSE